MNNKHLVWVLISLFFVQPSFAQNFTASFIKTVQIQNIKTSENTFIFKLNEGFKFSFDDLEADQKDYTYQIQHCTKNWKVSDLNTSQFLNGYDSFEINDFENSFNTLQSYTNYNFRIPNNNTSIKISGNFLITIFNEDDEICIQRRIVIYEPLVTISGKVIRDRNIKTISQNQVVQFSIYHPNLNINTPKQELNICILQNNDWNFIKENLKPQFFKKDLLIFNYNDETSFLGNNEFLNFDTKNFTGNHVSIAGTILEDIYNTYLYPKEARASSPYTYYPDINGNFIIRTINSENTHTEADYNKIHFSFEPNNSSTPQNMYIYGAYNNYELSDENKLIFNEESGLYENNQLLKQGFYNYLFATIDNNKVKLHKIDGSFFETENNYTILVYYKPFGARIGKIIGATTLQKI
jgi:hypothetical protein